MDPTHGVGIGRVLISPRRGVEVLDLPHGQRLNELAFNRCGAIETERHGLPGGSEACGASSAPMGPFR